MHEVSLLIDGVSRGASDGATFDRIDPATGQVASRAAAATLADADAAVAAAARALPGWAALAPTERRRRLLAAADAMDARAGEFIEIGRAETGAMANWYGFNVMLAANMLREAAAMTTQIEGAVIPSDVPGSLAMAVRQPCGVVLGIAPWNAPVILATRALAMPLACGNTVVLKASEGCPGVHRLIGSVLHDAGLGDGVVNVITHAPHDAPPIVERLIANPAVRRVNFTGSTRVGRIVATLAAQHLKPALLELGGKAPVLVLDDADLDAAVDAVAFGAFFNQGQICMSTERVIVDRKVADAFVDKLVAKARTLKAGNPAAPGVVLGTLESEAAAQRIAALVDDARAHGAALPLGCEVDGAVMQPTIVDGVTRDMKLYADESFGPVVTVQRVDDDEAALAAANDSEYGLSAAMFSRDIARAMQLAKRIESGICHINGPTVHDEAQMPFGGVKASGYGRFGSKASIAEFTDLRWITVQTAPRHYPI
ncbi:aldehyde dehydrogenase [Burkholderia multivorans]|uniref:aldehyde dehydrogenase n=1 Tax=Burkholderia multivorans TaxID=87883 RepID=UPI00084227FC|nr:aldehyde dehydrogenase [Burkholderia multivorans]AOJ94634.1 salicylaldehyde dehydrogenase [Burkholderia multivorans]MBU9240171.1 aldehyde dehydrogenase [Burkholderia multivorans]MCO1341221.1 aldehyde dehydrogenase [Burkholderia multivorans]MCO1441630.1 aldehyde dehydrogenase [Burkholderia multivorans]PRF86063.1 salicylaldehyde dehydrogenase [Burkholderia multivorans]